MFLLLHFLAPRSNCFVPPASISSATLQPLLPFLSMPLSVPSFVNPFFGLTSSASIILLRSSSSPLSPSSSLLLLKTMTSTRGHHNRKDLSE
ncbi:hypothetical protein Tsubulata_042202 [Turnera subulata]|uniref:Uncharacterized protein n=1 Tax=Turnera subulata TaxID=218843 RepID=A0A9Q0JB89_9ROSI|nr:hypothetical protein Tsubulata_042202 [Turnera subulata]